jgi:hypothetical protein
LYIQNSDQKAFGLQLPLMHGIAGYVTGITLDHFSGNGA